MVHQPAGAPDSKKIVVIQSSQELYGIIFK